MIPLPLEAAAATFTDFSNVNSEPVGSACAGVGWPIRAHRSMKCSWLAARSDSSTPDHFWTNFWAAPESLAAPLWEEGSGKAGGTSSR